MSDTLRLSETLERRPWYLAHVYQAMKAFIATRPHVEGSPALIQCQEIMDKAERDFNHFDGITNYTKQNAPHCHHERTNEDGICRRCGSDCRGIGGGA